MPTIGQLAPLIDSSNVYSLQKGNINLKEVKVRYINMDFYHTDQRSKNTLNYSISASLNFSDNAFADSTFIDNQNKRTMYVVNADGYRSANVSANIRKALKLKTSALQISLGSRASLTKSPGYINNAFSFSNNLNTNSHITFNYTYKSKLALETTENFSFYRSKQNSFNTNYSGTNTGSVFSSSYNVTKKFILNSNISFNSNKSSASKAINYNIWNASAIYRLLKGNNAEFKFTALDLLRQNNNIINNGSANSFTFGTRNVDRKSVV